MKTNDYGYELLDERQLNLRNKFGFQAFVLLVVLVFGYAILQQFGTSLIKPLNSAFVIVFTAVGYYQIRTALGGVYKKNEPLISIWVYAFIAIMAIATLAEGTSHYIWSIFLLIYSLSICIISFITWRKDKKDEKDMEGK